MGDYHTYYERKPGETTEWEDIQRKFGNLPPAEPVYKPDAFAPTEDVDRASRTFVDKASKRELEETEYDDDRFLEKYRRQRLEQLKAETATKAPTVDRIRREDFVHRVTHASEDSWVVCHLIKDHIVACLVMQDTLKQLAERFPRTRFVEIISTDCIPNYPDSNLPTLIVYHKKKCIKTIAGAMQFGALPTPENVFLVLNSLGEVLVEQTKPAEADDDEEEEEREDR